MPSLSAIVGGLLNLLGLVDWIKQALQTRKDKDQGAADLRAADNKETLNEVVIKNKLENEDETKSKSELISDYDKLLVDVADANNRSHRP
jgi:hypothetical protein